MVERLPEGTVTILFLDVVGSTALGVTAGDRVARERLRAREAAAREQLPRHRGREVKGTGDGMMAAFTSTRRAVDCAIDMQRAVERLNLAQPKQAVRMRIGVHCGEVFPERGDLFGSAVNAAARIESLADPGSIFVSEAVRMLLGHGADYRLTERGEFHLKGFDAPWRLFEVAWRDPRGASPAPSRSPLVGRERERLLMSGWLDAAESGRGMLGLLGGEPGVGKTRLTQEAVGEAQARGFLALTGRCYEMEGAPPYNPFVEMIESVAHALDANALNGVLGDDAPQAAKLVPRLRDLLPAMPPAPERPAALERRFLLDAMQAIVERLAARQPLLLVFEDLHWIDPATLALFLHVARRAAPLRLAILATYRDTEVFPERPFTAALSDLLRQEQTAELRVQRLTREAVGDLLRAYGGQDAPRRLLELVIAETEGNALFVEQVLKHLTEAGRVFDAAGRWLKDVDVAEDEVPHGVKHVIARRLDRVSADCRRVLMWAAIIGRAFSYELLHKLADFADEETLLRAMDEAQSALLISPEETSGESRLAFTHELIRQTLLGELSLPRRQRLHAQAADVIETAAGTNAERHASDIAQHLHLAGPAADASRAVRYLTIAGKKALGAAAFEDAHRLFDAALKRLPETAPERAELLYQRGLAGFSAGRWELAEPDWAAALTAAERTNAAALAGRTALDFGLQLAYAARPADSFDVARRGLAALGAQVSGVRARLLAFFAMTGCDLRQHDYAAAHAQLRDAARIAEAAHDRGAYGEVIGRIAHLYWRHALMAESAADYERACAVLEEAGDMYTLAHARAWHVLALVALGRFAEAAARAAGLEQYCERVGDPGALFATRRARGYMDFAMTADLTRWNEFAAGDLAFLEALGSRFTANSHAAIAYGRFWQGRWEEALPHAEQAQKLAIDDSWAGASAAPLLLLHAYLGNRDACRAALEHERRHLPVAGRVNESGAWELLPAAVEALAVAGEHAEAAALYPVALDGAQSSALIRYISKSLPHTTAGIAAACGREWAAAVLHFETAVQQAHDLPNRLEQAEARRWFAWMLLERGTAGDRERARALLTEAAASYAELGMPRHRTLAEDLQARA